MVNLDDVAEMALALPEVVEGERFGGRTWAVGGKVFVWERHFSKADLVRFGAERPPEGVILAASVDDLQDKESVLAAGHKGYFTIPHFDGYAAVLIALREADPARVAESVEDAWLARAPKRLVTQYLSSGAEGRSQRHSP